MRFAIGLSRDEPETQYRGQPLGDYDAVLPRIGTSITFFGLAVVRQFEQMKVYTPNTSNGIANSRDKLRSTQLFSAHGVGIPATTFARNRANVLPAIERVSGAPVVIKLLEGIEGATGLDIALLTLHRGEADIANPKASRALKAEDQLVCFDKLESIRALVPKRRRRSARPTVQELPEGDALLA